MDNSVDKHFQQTNNNRQASKGEFKALSQFNLELVVHATRIIVKLGMIVAIYLNKSAFTAALITHVIASELLDQLAIFISRNHPQVKKWVPIFYVLNSITVISAVAYFNHWVLNDLYLVYIVHISSATLGYGLKIGIFSFLLSTITYGFLLYDSQAPLIAFIRLPLFSIFALRLFTSQYMYEKVNNFLNHVLSIEKSKQDFIAIASHNLRTPVAAIYGYIELLLRGDAGKLNDDQAVFVHRIRSNNQELEKLTEKLLQISILEVGEEVNLFKQPSQIEVVIQDVVSKFESVAKAKGVELKFEKQAGLVPLVNIDVEKITTVISNLIDNGLKYTEKGQVIIRAVQVEDFIEVSVEDTGTGISEQELPKIFNKFYHSGNILVYNQAGTGLGLYLGIQFIKLHGGDMRVESEVNKGSRFSFTLPIIKEEDSV
ncbi:HAMP domain-containing histidine kinase [Candidatus Daviesbacteria bacterium]|nr:HAMP domain-containing histidine kinase [Candidatus Daviesbacteria bacterium]